MNKSTKTAKNGQVLESLWKFMLKTDRPRSSLNQVSPPISSERWVASSRETERRRETKRQLAGELPTAPKGNLTLRRNTNLELPLVLL